MSQNEAEGAPRYRVTGFTPWSSAGTHQIALELLDRYLDGAVGTVDELVQILLSYGGVLVNAHPMDLSPLAGHAPPRHATLPMLLSGQHYELHVELADEQGVSPLPTPPSSEPRGVLGREYSATAFVTGQLAEHGVTVESVEVPPGTDPAPSQHTGTR